MKQSKQWEKPTLGVMAFTQTEKARIGGSENYMGPAPTKGEFNQYLGPIPSLSKVGSQRYLGPLPSPYLD